MRVFVRLSVPTCARVRAYAREWTCTWALVVRVFVRVDHACVKYITRLYKTHADFECIQIILYCIIVSCPFANCVGTNKVFVLVFKTPK